MRRLFVGSFITLALGISGQGANLVTNGSFEAQVVPDNFYLEATTPTGWLSYGAQAPDILTVGYSGGTAADGVNYMDLIGGGVGVLPAGIRQDLTMTAGVTYAVSFRYNGDLNTPRALKYSLGPLGSLLLGSIDVSALNNFTDFGATTVWQLFSAQVTPDTSGTYSLAFYTTSGTFGSPYVDDVSVEAVTVPETSALAALLGAAGTVVLLRRCRRG
jgi:hypothetical protein